MRFLCRELADGALLAFLLKTAFPKELRSELLLCSDGKTNGHIGDIQFASDRHWTLFRSKSHIVPTSYGQPFPYISSLIFILTQTHFSNKQSTLITIVPAASDFGFLSGSAPSASPESQTQYHFLHRTPPAFLRFSSSKSSFTFDFPFKKFTIYFAPSSVRLFPTSHSPLSITRQIQHADRTRRFAQRQQHRQHSLLHDIVLYPSLRLGNSTRHEQFLQLRQRLLLQHSAQMLAPIGLQTHSADDQAAQHRRASALQSREEPVEHVRRVVICITEPRRAHRRGRGERDWGAGRRE